MTDKEYLLLSPWLQAWVDAQRAGDHDKEAEALQRGMRDQQRYQLLFALQVEAVIRLVESGFVTPKQVRRLKRAIILHEYEQDRAHVDDLDRKILAEWGLPVTSEEHADMREAQYGVTGRPVPHKHESRTVRKADARLRAELADWPIPEPSEHTKHLLAQEEKARVRAQAEEEAKRERRYQQDVEDILRERGYL